MYKKLIKDIFIYGAGTALPKAINLIFTYFFTSILSMTSFANVNDVFLFDFLMIQVLTFGFETAIFRFFSQSQYSDKAPKTALYTVSSSLIVFLIVGLVFYPQLADFRNYPSHYALFALFIIAFDTLSALGYVYLRLQEKSLKFSFIKVINVLVNALVLIILFGLNIETESLHKLLPFDKGGLILLATCVASVATFLMLSSELWRVIKQGIFDFSLMRRMLRFGAPIAVASIAYALNETFDKLFMKSVLGEETTGAYGACYKLGVFIMLYETAFRLGIEPFFFKQLNNDNKEKIYARAISIYVLFGSVFTVFVMSNLSWLKNLIVGNTSYFVAIAIVPIILFANMILGIYRNMSIWYKIIDKTYYGMIFSLVGVLVTLIGNVVVMQYTRDFMVGAWTTLISYSVMLLLSYIVSRRVNPIPYESIKVLIYLILSATVSYGLFIFDWGLLINNLIFMLFTLAVFLQEAKTIKSVLFK